MGDVDQIADRATAAYLDHSKQTVDDIVATATEAPSLSTAVDDMWEALATPLPSQAFDVPAEALVMAHCYGRLDVEHTDKGAALRDWTALPFAEAIAWFRGKRIMPKAEFAKLSDDARRQAFTIAGGHRQYALTRAHEVLTDALEQGTAQREAVKQLSDALGAAGLTRQSKHHLDNVFRTNVLGSYAEGRYQQSIKTVRSRPYWQYRTAGDNRVRPTHRAMDGHTARHDDPVWSTWYPKNGYQCRCEVVTLSQSDLEAEGINPGKPAPDVRPDQGFAGSPASAKGIEQAKRRLDRAVAKLPVLRPPKAATSGRAAFVEPGDLGWSRSIDRAAVVDDLSGMGVDQVRTELAGGAFNMLAARPGPLKAGAARFELTVPSVHADGLSQLVGRIAADPRTAKLAPKLKFEAVARYMPGEAPRRFTAAVVRDGLTRTTSIGMRVDVTDAQQIEALSEILLGAQAGSGYATRNAAEIADLVVTGLADVPPGYALADRQVRRVGSRTLSRVKPKGVDTDTGSAILITKRRAESMR